MERARKKENKHMCYGYCFTFVGLFTVGHVSTISLVLAGTFATCETLEWKPRETY